MEKATMIIAGAVLILGITAVASISSISRSGEKNRTDILRKSILDKRAREEQERKLAAIKEAREAERKRKQEQTMQLISLGMKAATMI